MWDFRPWRLRKTLDFLQYQQANEMGAMVGDAGVSDDPQFGVFPISSTCISLFFFSLPSLSFTTCSFHYHGQHSEAAIKPTPDTRTSTRPKTASSKQKEISGSLSGPLWPGPQSQLQVSVSIRFTCPYTRQPANHEDNSAISGLTTMGEVL